MINLERITTDLDRNLKNVEFSFKLHLIVFMFSLIVFGLFGILPLSTAIKTKFLLMGEMKDRYSILQSNLIKLQQAENEMNNNHEAISYLEQYMPEETSVQNYILDFVNIAEANGFSVKGFAQDLSSITAGNKDKQHDLTVYMEGGPYPTTMIQKIEKLKRVTQVKSFTLLNSDKGEQDLNLIISIFNYVL